jgi:outer membrane protein assembly factor BamB
MCRAGISQWPTLGGNTHHSGFNANETGTPPLTLAWSATVGTTPLWAATSDGTTIYVSVQNEPNRTPQVWALSAVDGRVLWSHYTAESSSPFLGQTTISGASLFVAQDASMYSFVRASGIVTWSHPVNSSDPRFWAPLVVGGNVYFDGDNTLSALYAETGSELFQDVLGFYDQWAPLSLGGNIYTFVGGHLRAHDPLTGNETWTASVPWSLPVPDLMTAPVSDGTQIYVIAPPSLYAFVPGQPTPQWTRSDAYSGMPAVANGVVYSISNGSLHANDASTGAIRWTFAADGALNHPPAVAGRWVYVASDLHVFAVDSTTQTASWTGAPGGWLSIAGGHLYVGQPNGVLATYALTR